MKRKLTFAALAAAITLTALPAAAQDYRRGNDRGGGGGEIVVRHDAGTFRFDRSDREYRRLVRTFGFQPGYRYEYTHTCNAYGCDVIAYEPGRSRAVDRFRAPYFANAFANGRVPGNPHHNDSQDNRRDRDDRRDRDGRRG
ncbi:MAG: hypothetical protein H7124_10030 [Phycisphaerales bacterium]|nr:hypothetical protein [Hyphomonadaceae bacterium]